MARTRAEFTVHFIIAKDGGEYSALCYEYNVATCGATAKEAFLALMDATVSYLEFFLDKGEEPPPRPASAELLLEFLELDPTKKSYSKDEVSKALAAVVAGTVRLEAPVYSLRKRGFTRPIERVIPRLGAGSYPVTIHA